MNRPYLGAYSKTRFLEETGFLGTIAQGVLTVGIAPELIWVCFPTPYQSFSSRVLRSH